MTPDSHCRLIGRIRYVDEFGIPIPCQGRIHKDFVGGKGERFTVSTTWSKGNNADIKASGSR
jgi:hypothetical protein